VSIEIETRELVTESEGLPVAQAVSDLSMNDAESDDLAIEEHEDVEVSDAVIVDATEELMDDDGLDDEADDMLADAEDAAAEID
jgi:hypothetical protein